MLLKYRNKRMCIKVQERIACIYTLTLHEEIIDYNPSVQMASPPAVPVPYNTLL